LLPTLPQPIAEAICLLAFAGDHTQAEEWGYFPCCGKETETKFKPCNPSAALVFDVDTGSIRHTLPDGSEPPYPWEETLPFKPEFVPTKGEYYGVQEGEHMYDITLHQTKLPCSHRFERGRLPRHPGRLKPFSPNGYCNVRKVGWNCCNSSASYCTSPLEKGCIPTAPEGEEAEWTLHE
jgi:hypothetical protein